MSTTRSATRRATGCSSKSRRACAAACARATRWRGWAAMNSRWCSLWCRRRTRRRALAHRARAALAEPLEIDGRAIHAGASVGVTLFPDDARDLDALLRNADLALYRAKSNPRRPVAFYAEHLGRRAEERLAVVEGLPPRAHREPLRAALPAHGAPRGWPRGRRRGAVAVAPSGARAVVAGGVHRPCRGGGVDRSHRRMGARPGLRAARRVAARRRARGADLGQRLGRAVPRPGVDRQIAREPERASTGAALSGPGDHRKRAHARRSGGGGDARPPGRARRRPGDRRFWRRLFVAQLPETPAGGQTEDRCLLRARGDSRPARFGDRRRHRPSRPQSGDARAGRGGGDCGAIGGAPRPRVRPGPGPPDRPPLPAEDFIAHVAARSAG